MSKHQLIEWSAVDRNGTLVHGVYAGSYTKALEAGLLELLSGDGSLSREGSRVRYHDGVSWYEVSTQDVASLGAAVLSMDSEGDCYSDWCSGADAEEVDGPFGDDT